MFVNVRFPLESRPRLEANVVGQQMMRLAAQRTVGPSGGDPPPIPTGLASLALRALGGPNGNGASKPIRVEEQDLYRLERLTDFLDSAVRGIKPLKELSD